jgi:asparagine synthase (glutamine-hydrolysing)
MAHSIECRSPLLDHELFEFVARLPSRFKYNNGTKKHILKDAYNKYFPEGFFNRPKSGFSVPLQHWFSTDLEKFAITNIFSGPLKDLDLFDLSIVKKIIDENKAGKRDHGELIWKLLVLSEWFKRFA